MKVTVIKTFGWAVITTIVFVASSLVSGATLEVAVAASLIGTFVKTPLYFGYESFAKWIAS